METNAPFFAVQEQIVLTKNGVWLADGAEITHEPTRRLFAKSLKKNAEGYFLSIGRETLQIQVEDTAYFVLRIDGNLETGYQLLLSDESREILNPQTLDYQAGRLVCRIKGQEVAKFLQAPYIDLLRNLQEDGDSYFLTFGKSGAQIRVKLADKS